MATIRERIPRPARGPVSVGLLLVGVLAVAIGYAITMFGLMAVIGLQPYADPIPTIESIKIVLIGIVTIVAGYVGFKGFFGLAY